MAVEVVDLSLLQQDQKQVDLVAVEQVVEILEQLILVVVVVVEHILVEQVELAVVEL